MKKEITALLLSWLFVLGIYSVNASKPIVQLENKSIANGGVAYFTINVSDINIENLRVEFIGQKIHLIDKSMNEVVGLIGVKYDTEPGEYFIEVFWQQRGKTLSRKYYITVKTGNYPVSTLTVDGKRVSLHAADQKRAKDESNMLKNEIYGKPDKKIYWNNKFDRPLTSIITSPFGVQRVFNGKKKSHHGGVDFRAAIGTKIKSTNNGVVRLAKNLFYGGNVIIIDHGSNIFSSYSHLSEFKVQQGEVIKKGQIIALSGNTGRVNGPHLHFGIKLNGISVSPLEFLTIFNKAIE